MKRLIFLTYYLFLYTSLFMIPILYQINYYKMDYFSKLIVFITWAIILLSYPYFSNQIKIGDKNVKKTTQDNNN